MANPTSPKPQVDLTELERILDRQNDEQLIEIDEDGNVHAVRSPQDRSGGHHTLLHDPHGEYAVHFARPHATGRRVVSCRFAAVRSL